jgi:hypothetical protein
VKPLTQQNVENVVDESMRHGGEDRLQPDFSQGGAQEVFAGLDAHQQVCNIPSGQLGWCGGRTPHALSWVEATILVLAIYLHVPFVAVPCGGTGSVCLNEGKPREEGEAEAALSMRG